MFSLFFFETFFENAPFVFSFPNFFWEFSLWFSQMSSFLCSGVFVMPEILWKFNSHFLNFNLEQLETFVWVADLGGFRKAAARLNTTQPNISSRISALEIALNV